MQQTSTERTKIQDLKPRRFCTQSIWMSWHQVRRWTHNKYSNSRNILNSHCSPNARYLFLNTDSAWIMAHITHQCWGYLYCQTRCLVDSQTRPKSSTLLQLQCFLLAVSRALLWRHFKKVSGGSNCGFLSCWYFPCPLRVLGPRGWWCCW